MKDNPIIIGGMGGSGTSAFAHMMVQGGVYTGVWMNSTLDTGGVFFDRIGKCMMKEDENGMLTNMRMFLFIFFPRQPEPWGFKSPLSYLLIPELNKVFPNMRFVHVIRDGCAMAFPNTNHPCTKEDGLHQGVERYGRKFLSCEEMELDPAQKNALYWARTNLKALEDVASLDGRGITVKYEDLVEDPVKMADMLQEHTGTIWHPGGIRTSNAYVHRGKELPEMASARATFGYV